MLFFADLDEAIERLTDGKRANLECPAVREQLCEWLKELKWSREILSHQCKDCVFYSWIDCDHCAREGTYELKDENDKACKFFQLAR